MIKNFHFICFIYGLYIYIYIVFLLNNSQFITRWLGSAGVVPVAHPSCGDPAGGELGVLPGGLLEINGKCDLNYNNQCKHRSKSYKHIYIDVYIIYIYIYTYNLYVYVYIYIHTYVYKICTCVCIHIHRYNYE